MGNVFYIIFGTMCVIGIIMVLCINFDVGEKLSERKQRNFSKMMKFYSDDDLLDMFYKSKPQNWKRLILRNELTRRVKISSTNKKTFLVIKKSFFSSP